MGEQKKKPAANYVHWAGPGMTRLILRIYDDKTVEIGETATHAEIASAMTQFLQADDLLGDLRLT